MNSATASTLRGLMWIRMVERERQRLGLGGASSPSVLKSETTSRSRRGETVVGLNRSLQLNGAVSARHNVRMREGEDAQAKLFWRHPLDVVNDEDQRPGLGREKLDEALCPSSEGGHEVAECERAKVRSTS